MKLLVQADDYGITRGVSKGIIYGIEHGIIRNTGIFTNMPWSEECAKWIDPFSSKIALGIDLNLTTGSPLCDKDMIPSLVNSDGSFHSSSESRKLDAELGSCHVNIDEAYMELTAQIEKYIELFKRKPDYIHSHAYTTIEIEKLESQLAKQYGIPYCSDIMNEYVGIGVGEYRIPWYNKPATLENQANSSLKDYIISNEKELLKKDYVMLIGHMGYVDEDLLRMSSYSLYRAMDLAAVIDEEIICWVKENSVDLITYKELNRNI